MEQPSHLLGNLCRMSLCQISDSYNHLPWATLGDYDVARFLDEKIGGKPLSIHKLKDFNGCISYCLSLILQAQVAVGLGLIKVPVKRELYVDLT